MQFFSNISNHSDIPTATIVPNITAANKTTVPNDPSFDPVQTFLPALAVLALLLHLFRLCYKALREDDDTLRENNDTLSSARGYSSIAL
jgi:hypothetical protein